MKILNYWKALVKKGLYEFCLYLNKQNLWVTLTKAEKKNTKKTWNTWKVFKDLWIIALQFNQSVIGFKIL